MRTRMGLFALVVLLAVSACSAPLPPPDLLATTDEQMKLRSYQSRSFEADRTAAIRAVISVLRLSTIPKVPSSSWWTSRTTVRRKFGSRSCGIATRKVGASELMHGT